MEPLNWTVGKIQTVRQKSKEDFVHLRTVVLDPVNDGLMSFVKENFVLPVTRQIV